MSAADDAAEEIPDWVKRPKTRYRLDRFDLFIVFCLVAGFLTLLLWPLVFFIVQPGEVGVLFRTLTTGTQTNFVYPEGLGTKLPWNRIYRYEVRTKNLQIDVQGLASDGLRVNVDVSVLYRPAPEQVGRLHKEVGPFYMERLVRPRAVEAVREVIGTFAPHDLYTHEYSKIERLILSRLQRRLQETEASLIEYQAVVIRRIVLPKALNEAITYKLTQEQNALAYQYILDREQQEAERKRIEAIGYQTFYSIVADALSPQLLTWRGIQATVELAKSNNAKVVIVGGSKDQLPLILGSDIARQPDLPAPQAVDPDSFKLPDFDELKPLFKSGTLTDALDTAGEDTGNGSEDSTNDK